MTRRCNKCEKLMRTAPGYEVISAMKGRARPRAYLFRKLAKPDRQVQYCGGCADALVLASRAQFHRRQETIYSPAMAE